MSTPAPKMAKPSNPETAEPLWRANFSLLVTAAVFVSFVMKVLASARGHVPTALAILEAAGPAQVLFGVTLRTGMVMAIAIAGGAALGVLLATEPGDLHSRGLAATIGVGVAGTIFISLAAGLAFLLLAVVVELAIRRGWRLPGGGDADDRFDWRLPVAAFALVLTLVANDKMWLPAHVIETADGPRAMYVLRETDTKIVVLEDASRQIETWASTDIADGGICSDAHGDWWERSALAFSATQRYPECPKAP